MNDEFAGLIGFGHALPEKVRTNEDPIFDWLRQNRADECQLMFQGYVTRRVLDDGERVEDIAVEAAGKALDDAGVDAREIDLLVGAVSVGQYVAPNALAAVHRALGLNRSAAVLPLNVEFNTFNKALLLATSMIDAGRIRNALLVCAGDWSRHVSYKACESWSAADGAGACVVGLTGDRAHFGLVDQVALADCVDYGAMRMKHGRTPLFEITKKGRDVFRDFGVKRPPEAAKAVLERNGLEGSDVGLISHQAAARLMDHWRARIQPRAYLESLEELANMTLATIPVNLSRTRDAAEGLDHLLLLGIGIEFQTTAVLLGRGGEVRRRRRRRDDRATPSTRPAPRGTTVARMLLHYLGKEGVTEVFGVPGGAVKTVLSELRERGDPMYVVCRHETGAAYIADGYARVSSRLGVVLVTSGPGGTNTLTGALNAQSSGVSLLTITGEPPTKFRGLGYLQEGVDAGLDIEAIFDNAVAYSRRIVSGASAQTEVAQALRVALSEPRGGAHLALPDDVAQQPLPPGATLPSRKWSYRARPKGISPRETRAAFDRFLKAERPLLLLGNGCRRAFEKPGGKSLDRVKRLAERYGIPVVTTPDAKGIFPESHPLSLRTYGTAGCTWTDHYMAEDAEGRRYDALFVLASDLGDFSTARFSADLRPAGPIFQVDLNDAAIGRAYPVDIGVVGGVEGTIWYLDRLSKRRTPVASAVRARKRLVSSIKDRHSPFRDPDKRSAREPRSRKRSILPQALMRCVGETLPRKSHIFVDSGNCVGWCVHYMEIDPPTTLRPALDMGPMGFAVGAVVGAALACRDEGVPEADPDFVCAAVVGDGAFLMHGAELSTAARYDVAPIVIVLYDGDLNMVSQGMHRFYGGELEMWRDIYHLGNPDITGFARSLGAEAHDVYSEEEATAAIANAVKAASTGTRPQVVVAHVDPAEVPPYYPPKL